MAATAPRGAISVSWVPPLSSATSPVARYLATAFPGGQSCQTVVPATTCDIAGLASGVLHVISLSAGSAVGYGPVATGAPVAPGAAAPSPPVIASVISGNGAITVAISPGGGGGPATSFTVVAQPGGASCTVISPASTCVISGLTNGTSYTLSAIATGPGGISGPSTSAGPVTPTAPVVPVIAPIPSALAPGVGSGQQARATVQVRVTSNPQSNGVLIGASETSMDLQGVDAQGRPLPLSAEGVLVLQTDRILRTSGIGFFPNSYVILSIDPPIMGSGRLLQPSASGTYLGRVLTDADGSFDDTVLIDDSIGVGDHVLQASGVRRQASRAPTCPSSSISACVFRIRPPHLGRCGSSV